jgi:hypothetical protein
MPVRIMVLGDASKITVNDRGRRMAEALEALAATQGLNAIADPVAWQRDVRQDRSLTRQSG